MSVSNQFVCGISLMVDPKKSYAKNQHTQKKSLDHYSATTFLEKCRKVVLEKWFGKLGFFFLVNHFSPTWKKQDLWYKTSLFPGQPLFSNQISQTRFLEPDFLNQISKNCKNRGRRIKGWLVWHCHGRAMPNSRKKYTF